MTQTPTKETYKNLVKENERQKAIISNLLDYYISHQRTHTQDYIKALIADIGFTKEEITQLLLTKQIPMPKDYESRIINNEEIKEYYEKCIKI